MGARILGIGWWEYNSHPERGTFFCTKENAEREYRITKVNRWITVLYIPLLPLGAVAQVVECKKCKSLYGMETKRTPYAGAANRPTPSPSVTATIWTPNRQVPPGGMAAWPRPEATLEPTARLAERVQLRVDEVRGAWAKVTGSNGWVGWVDERLLLPLPESETPPDPTPPAPPPE